MEDERVVAEAGFEEGFLDRLQTIEIEMLFAFEFVGAVGVADGE